MEQLGFSIVVPVYNRKEDLKRCIESLLALEYEAYEIIIVDNGSSDGSKEAASGFPVTVLSCEKRGPGAARNVGIRAAKHEVIAFTDSDCVVDKNWLTVLSRGYTSDDIGGVGGKTLSVKPETAVQAFLEDVGVLTANKVEACELGRSRRRFLPEIAGTANVSYKRDALQRIGGFDEDLLRCQDFQIFMNISDLGLKVMYDPDAIVLHRHRSTVPGMMRQYYGWGRGQVLLLKKQKEKVSYLRTKLYVTGLSDFRIRSPFRVFFTLDALHVVYLCILMGVFFRPLLWFGLGGLGVFILSSLIRGFVKRTKGRKAIWIFAYPLFRLLMNGALSVGRFTGGLKYRVIAL